MRTRRVVAGLLVIAGVLAFVLTSCPSNRDGMAGQLATAEDETQSAADARSLSRPSP